MQIEITSVEIHQGIVTLTAIDCSEEHLQMIERNRTDGFERELIFVFDTKSDRNAFHYLRNWLKEQRITKNAKTYGEALNLVRGTVTTISGKYLECV